MKSERNNSERFEWEEKKNESFKNWCHGKKELGCAYLCYDLQP